MKKLARLWTVIGAAAVLIVGIVSAAPAAMAGTDSTATVCDSYCPAGTVNWHNYGDTFNICDNAPDGYAVAVVAKRPSGGEVLSWDTHGAGTCVNAAFDFSEGYQIPMQACLGVASTNTLDICGPWNYTGVT